jgi:hypothetical protein
MPKTYEKLPNGKLKVTDVETKTEVKILSLKDLRRQKQFLKDKLDAIQILIDQAVLLSADEGV